MQKNHRQILSLYSPFPVWTPAEKSRLARKKGLQQDIISWKISAKGLTGVQGKATGNQGKNKAVKPPWGR